MKGKNRVLAGLLLAALIAQVSLMPFLQVAHVRPDLFLILVVLAGLAFGPRETLYLGLGAGLLQDLLAGRYLGMFTAGKLAVAALAGLVGQKVYMDHVLTPVVTAFSGTFVQGAAMMVVVVLGGAGQHGFDWGRALLVEAGFNAVLAGVFFGMAARLGRRFKEGTHPLDHVRTPWL